jgi:hypothetical protein
MAENTIRLMSKATTGLGAIMTLLAATAAVSLDAPQLLMVAPMALAAAVYGRLLDRRYSAAL